jgi:protein phosphatase
MGSRAVVVVCRDEEAARRAVRRGGDEGIGIVYTRTGRRFFDDRRWRRASRPGARRADGAGVLGGAGDGLGRARLRADALVGQGAGADARPSTPRWAPPPARRWPRPRRCGWPERGAPVGELAARYAGRAAAGGRLRGGVPPLLLAGASSPTCAGALPPARDRGRGARRPRPRWHMETSPRARGVGPAAVSHPVPRGGRDRPGERAEAVAWWEELTGAGGEGMVVKPLEFIARGRRGCRSRR